jgi:hypothetical protein
MRPADGLLQSLGVTIQNPCNLRDDLVATLGIVAKGAIPGIEQQVEGRHVVGEGPAPTVVEMPPVGVEHLRANPVLFGLLP